jgi:hypothetical protein
MSRQVDPKPVVTMVERHGDEWIYLDGVLDGMVRGYEPLSVSLEPIHTATELRAIVDFLEQLEGADLLGQVTG